MNLCKAQFVLCLSGSLKVYLGSFQVMIRLWTLLKFTCAQEWASLCALHVAWLQNQRITSFNQPQLKINQRTYTELLVIRSMDTNIAHMQHWSFGLLQHHQLFRCHHQVDWNTKLCLYQSRERVFFRLQLLSTYLGEFAVHIHVSDM